MEARLAVCVCEWMPVRCRKERRFDGLQRCGKVAMDWRRFLLVSSESILNSNQIYKFSINKKFQTFAVTAHIRTDTVNIDS